MSDHQLFTYVVVHSQCHCMFGGRNFDQTWVERRVYGEYAEDRKVSRIEVSPKISWPGSEIQRASNMWQGISQLNDSRYEMRRVQRFPEKFQRPLSDREKMLIKKVKEGVKDDRGVTVPNIKVLDDYKCPKRERRIVMDEVCLVLISSSFRCLKLLSYPRWRGEKDKTGVIRGSQPPTTPTKSQGRDTPTWTLSDAGAERLN